MVLFKVLSNKPIVKVHGSMPGGNIYYNNQNLEYSLISIQAHAHNRKYTSNTLLSTQNTWKNLENTLEVITLRDVKAQILNNIHQDAIKYHG